MGAGADRGINQLAQTDLVRNEWSAINAIVDQIMLKIPYKGSAVWAPTADGSQTVYHGLGFTPSFLQATCRRNTLYSLDLRVMNITADNFKVVFFRIRDGAVITSKGDNLTFIDWSAYK